MQTWPFYAPLGNIGLTRSIWSNCALRGDGAEYWVSIGQQWLVLGGTESI